MPGSSVAGRVDDDDNEDGMLRPAPAVGAPDPRRHSTLLPATFNLVATIVGGGVLSLPLAFQKCGIAVATVLMVLSAALTDFSLRLLCRCSSARRRRPTARSFGEVARDAFGPRAEELVSALLFAFLLFVLVAYMVLVRDIWTPLVLALGGTVGRGGTRRGEDGDRVSGDLVLLGALVATSPFLVQRELHTLRYNCYVGFASLAVMCLALCLRAWDRRASESYRDDPVRYGMGSREDILFAFPIVVLSFLCHFNILPIQSALVRPTRRRIRSVIDNAVLASFGLMYLFGLGGYLCFGSDTQGNILLNLSTEDSFIIYLGRIGVGITILLAIPMIALPCRRNILELLDCWMEVRLRRSRPVAPLVQEEEDALVRENTPLIHQGIVDTPLEVRQHLLAENSVVAHYVSTAFIVLGCYLGAVAAPGVAVVWSLCGSFMAFLIGFVLPSAFFLQIQRKVVADGAIPPESIKLRIGAWMLLTASLLAAILCTFQTTLRLLRRDSMLGGTGENYNASLRMPQQ
jgi:amino acid permease